MTCKPWCGTGEVPLGEGWGEEAWCSRECAAACKPLNPTLVLRYKLLADVPTPEYQTAGASGIDLCCAESFTLERGETTLVPTGVAVEIPAGFEGQVRPRSSLSSRGVHCHAGTIDPDYRGQIYVVLSDVVYIPRKFEKGDRIAQLVIAPVERVELVRVEQLSETARGERGFGHTGRR